LAFDWNEYRKLAEFLSKYNGSDFSVSAARRSAVSRAYFATYCCARNYACRKLSFVPANSSDDHTNLKNHLRNKNLNQWATDLDRLRQDRNACDYDSNSEIDVEAMVRSALRISNHLLGKFSK
jgi:hypothetical protein